MRATIAVFLLVALMPVASPLGGARSASAAGDLLLPARYPAVAPTLMNAGAGEDGLLVYALENPSDGAAAVTFVRVPGQPPRRFDGVGSAGVAGRFVMLVDGTSSQRAVQMFDAATGAVRPVPSDSTHAPLVPLPDGGWVGMDQDANGIFLARHAPDGATTGVLRTGQTAPTRVRADAEGAMWQQSPPSATSGTVLSYGSWSTGRSSVLWSGPAVVGSALTSSHVVYGQAGSSESDTIVRRRRSDLSVVNIRTVGPQVAGLAATDAATGWVTRHGGTATTTSFWTSSESNPTSHVRAAAGLPDAYQHPFVVGSGFGAIAGSTSRTRGIYPVAVGATSLGEPLALVGPRAPSGLSAGPGRVVFLEPTTYFGQYTAVEQGIDVMADGPVLRGGEVRLAGGGSFPGAEMSGGSIAMTQATIGREVDAVVQDHGVEIGRVRTSGHLAGFSGNRLAVADQMPVGSPSRHRLRVVDISDTSVPHKLFEGLGDVYGSQAVTMTDDGTVTLHDLLSGQSSALRPAGPGPAGATFRRVQISDGWAAWSWLAPDGQVLQTVASDISPQAVPDSRREVTVAVPHEQPQLAGGRLAWIDIDDRQVHAQDLATGTDEIVGVEQAQAPGRGLLALAPDFVAWVNDQGQTVVHQLAEPAGQATLLSTVAPAGFSPRTGLRIRSEADRAVDTVEMTVTDTSGAVVARSTSPAADGGLRPAWNARLADGRVAPSGRYRWQISATDNGQQVQLSPEAPTEGTAVLDITPPSLTASAPVAASDTSVTAAFRLGWSSTDPSAVFDVAVSKRGRQPSGIRAFGPLRTWQRGRPAGSAVYTGADLPYQAPPGTLMRFVISARDPAGNTTSSTRDVLVPYDEGISPQQFSLGWGTPTSTSSAYFGRTRSSTTRGTTLTVRATTNRFLVVGARCSTCGAFTVTVDGRLFKTVDSYSRTSQQRQRLLDLRLTGAPALHTIVIRNTATAGRPRIVLDGIGLVA